MFSIFSIFSIHAKEHVRKGKMPVHLVDAAKMGCYTREKPDGKDVLKMKLGVQIYGCMREFRADPEAFCTRLRAAGYTQIEPCVSLSMDAAALEQNGMNPVWQPAEAAGFIRLLQNHGLSFSSCHVFGDLRADAEKAAAFAAENGARELVVNCPGGETAESYRRFAESCLYLAEKFDAVGVQLWVHNGWPEIRAHFDGKTGLELVLEACGGKVGAQIDVGWVLYGGEDPVAYLETVRPYLRSIHYKDVRPALPLDQIHVPLGDGALNWRGVRAFARQNGIPELIDQDVSAGDFLLDLEQSARRLAEA